MNYVEWVDAVLRATVAVRLEAGRSILVGLPHIAAKLGFADAGEIDGWHSGRR